MFYCVSSWHYSVHEYLFVKCLQHNSFLINTKQYPYTLWQGLLRNIYLNSYRESQLHHYAQNYWPSFVSEGTQHLSFGKLALTGCGGEIFKREAGTLAAASREMARNAGSGTSTGSVRAPIILFPFVILSLTLIPPLPDYFINVLFLCDHGTIAWDTLLLHDNHSSGLKNFDLGWFLLSGDAILGRDLYDEIRSFSNPMKYAYDHIKIATEKSLRKPRNATKTVEDLYCRYWKFQR